MDNSVFINSSVVSNLTGLKKFDLFVIQKISPWLRDISKVNPQKVYYRICILRYLLFSVSPNYTGLKSKLCALMEKYSTVDIAAMGFPTDWEDEPLWKI